MGWSLVLSCLDGLSISRRWIDIECDLMDHVMVQAYNDTSSTVHIIQIE